MLRGLIHHWRINLAVAAGAAVATAVLAGAVIVGDSMRASLLRLTLDRLGDIDWALVAEEPFRSELGVELETAWDGAEISTAPAMLSTASAVNAESRALATRVSLLGIDDRFSSFFGAQAAELGDGLERRDGQMFPSVVINRSLAREIDIEAGDDLLLSFEQVTDIPRESLLGNRPQEGAIAALRATVTAVLPDRGVGRFALSSHQERSFNAFVQLDILQSRLDRSGRANALFIAAPDAVQDAALHALLRRSLTFDDFGLDIATRPDSLAVSNRRFVLRDTTVEANERVAEDAGAPAQQVLGYLANRMSHGERSVPYSMMLGLDTPVPPALGALTDLSGASIGLLEDDEVVLGQWAASELEAAPGDTIAIDFFSVGRDDELETSHAELRVAAIAGMSGLMVDAKVLPDFPGIANADDIAGWEPPFPMDLGLVRPQDEDFWDSYGAAPKAVVNLATAQRLWSNRFGRVTTVRIAVAAAGQSAFQTTLRQDLDPESFGLSLQPVKRQGLEASSGATDFAGLFLAFSVFLIAAAGLVVGLLFSLSVEMRAREVGLRRALGFPLARVRRQLLIEGLVLALVGAIAGLVLAIGYAAALIQIIAGLWADILDLPLLTLDVDVSNVGAAVAGAIVLVLLTIVLTIRRLGRMAIPAQLAGAVRPSARRATGRRAKAVALGSFVAGSICTAVALASRSGTSPALFFGAGALFLIAGLSGFAATLRRGRGNLGGSLAGAYAGMAARNSAFNPGRSLLSVALVACATFMLVSVAANRRVLRPETLGRDSGTGGFSLVAESDVPIRGSLGGDETLADLGLSEEAVAALADAEVYPLRLLPGDDASCLNLYQPETPRVVGVPPAFIDRGGFDFGSTVEPRDDPWELLRQDLGEGVIPAFGDANSVTWILHSGLGQDIELVDDHGQPVRLRLVGLLRKSIFQSELIVSEGNFLRHFPQHGGYPYFLLETPPESIGATAAVLESDLARYGFDATTTVDKLARFLGIEEMYLSTFQLLGGLGLILGTVGLGVVLVRNVNERRSELAMLRAVGFRRRSIAALILMETGFQLACGLLIGTASGFLALLPYFLDTSLHLPWSSLLGTVATVIVVGMLSAAVGVSAALRAPLLPALKAD